VIGGVVGDSLGAAEGTSVGSLVGISVGKDGVNGIVVCVGARGVDDNGKLHETLEIRTINAIIKRATECLISSSGYYFDR
jgi:hypothetical protein